MKKLRDTLWSLFSIAMYGVFVSVVLGSVLLLIELFWTGSPLSKFFFSADIPNFYVVVAVIVFLLALTGRLTVYERGERSREG